MVYFSCWSREWTAGRLFEGGPGRSHFAVFEGWGKKSVVVSTARVRFALSELRLDRGSPPANEAAESNGSGKFARIAQTPDVPGGDAEQLG